MVVNILSVVAVCSVNLTQEQPQLWVMDVNAECSSDLCVIKPHGKSPKSVV